MFFPLILNSGNSSIFKVSKHTTTESLHGKNMPATRLFNRSDGLLVLDAKSRWMGVMEG